MCFFRSLRNSIGIQCSWSVVLMRNALFQTHAKQADTCVAVGYFRVCNVVVVPKGANKLNINMLNC